MTSIEWLIEQFNLQAYSPHIEQAKEMHYKELMDSMQRGMEIQQKYNSRKGFRERNDLSEKPTHHKDKIVQQVIDKFNQRSEVGIKKYGTTLEQNNNDDYLTHLQEELMDAVLYIEKLKSIEFNTLKKPVSLSDKYKEYQDWLNGIDNN